VAKKPPAIARESPAFEGVRISPDYPR